MSMYQNAHGRKMQYCGSSHPFMVVVGVSGIHSLKGMINLLHIMKLISVMYKIC